MVTGSSYLLEEGEDKILIDCGLHQGSHFCEKHNWQPFAFEVEKIKAVLVTHAHIDHTGLLPKLYKSGFRGTVYSTPPTKDFARELLLDSEDILRREAEREGQPPIYSAGDVEGLMSGWQTKDYYENFEVAGFKIIFRNAGHILGSSSIYVERGGKVIVFSGDLGGYNPPIIKEGDKVFPPADFCLIESAYGDRLHPKEDEGGILEDVIEETVKAKGVLMIPVFAMERTQKLLYELNGLIEGGRIPRISIFLDSPLAIKLTAVYKLYTRYFNADAKKLMAEGDQLFNFPGLKTTLTTEESKAINGVPPPKMVIAGAGMSNGGRIVHHERRYLSDPKSAILFIGYQVEGSLGRRIEEGVKTVKIFDEEVPVRCKVREMRSYSAHADQARLLDWIFPGRGSLKKVFVVQGETQASEALALKIRDELALETIVPSLGDSVVLS